VGWIGVANAAFVFPLATRNSIFLTFMGISYERIIKFHRWVGRMIIVCIMFHGMGHIQKRYYEDYPLFQYSEEDILKFSIGLTLLVS
ncbi:11944_t:CDS:2, partial [Entrophospora sp. SA101]